MITSRITGLKAIVIASILTLSITACTTHTGSGYTPSQLTGTNSSSVMTSSSDYYTVKPGDTLYSIAFVHNIDMKTLAYINGIRAPYSITKGQQLVLDPAKVGVKTHRVQKNDTAYRISKKYGISLRELVALNDIDSDYTIMVGQLLVVSKKGRPVASNSQNVAKHNNNNQNSGKTATSTSVSAPTGSTASSSGRQSAKQTSNPQKTAVAKGSGVKWTWPVRGRLIEKFSSSEHGNKGIDIGGKRGTSIKSAAPGKIVYAGNALRGYGNLVIISHNNDFLSAYANNDQILVREGQEVKAGQVIAKMGDTEAKSVRLHFEIRYHGQTVNPLKYLP